MLESMGISVEFSHHEGAPGQQEIDLRYADALTTADNIMTFRQVMKQVALEQNVYASFMPKPFTEHPGSGMHTHLSLFEGDRNAFFEAGAQYQLSKTARAFIAGILRHASEITAVTNQFVNSYKRLWGGTSLAAGAGGEAPSYVCWGHNNRSALVRVPMYKPLKGNSTRVEIRSPDPACNPYLAFALLLGAGLKGIEEGYDLPDGAEDDVWALTESERRAMGIKPLPASLAEAISRHGDLRAGRERPRRARVRLLPAQQARRVGRLPASGHRLRARPLPADPLRQPRCPLASGRDHQRAGAAGQSARPLCPPGLHRRGAGRRHRRPGRDRLRAPDRDRGQRGSRPGSRIARASGRGDGEQHGADDRHNALALDLALRADVDFRRRLFAVLGSSAALGDHLATHPADWVDLADPGFDDSRPTWLGLRATLTAAVAGKTGPAAEYALRSTYRRLLMRLAARDLTGQATVDDVAAELADLASATLDAALVVATAELGADAVACRLAVIGMGKCGGRELNYISDVDVVFVAEPAADDVDEVAALRTAGQLAAGIIRVCASIWEVDTALRPEGKMGPLVRTLASHVAYYQRWAKTWEFQALLKARPVAGDFALGQAYVDALRPMVWTAAGREHFVEDVQAMRRRVEASLPAADAEREIKLGPGGLRDVEFAVQLLQLVHGRADDTLRSATTLNALADLAAGGYVGRRDAVLLADAYRFLRTLEHRLQLHHLRRTHLLPIADADIRRLGRGMGFRRDPVGELHAEHARHAREVRRLHEKLFYRPLLAAVARLPGDEARLSLDAAAARLEALGYTDPESALRHLEALTSGLSRRAAIQRTLLPVMLSWFADAPDPDGGLLAFRQVSDSLGDTHWYLRLLRDEGAAAQHLALVLASGRYAAELVPAGARVGRDDGRLG